jgi:hypothetical protein
MYTYIFKCGNVDSDKSNDRLTAMGLLGVVTSLVSVVKSRIIVLMALYVLTSEGFGLMTVDQALFAVHSEIFFKLVGGAFFSVIPTTLMFNYFAGDAPAGYVNTAITMVGDAAKAVGQAYGSNFITSRQGSSCNTDHYYSLAFFGLVALTLAVGTYFMNGLIERNINLVHGMAKMEADMAKMEAETAKQKAWNEDNARVMNASTKNTQDRRLEDFVILTTKQFIKYMEHNTVMKFHLCFEHGPGTTRCATCKSKFNLNDLYDSVKTLEANGNA